jgi:hypothetical protein
MVTVDVATGVALYRQHKGNRAGINRKPEMASVCLICGSIHMDPDPKDPEKLICRNCGFAFRRYDCPTCASTIDSRDPSNRACSVCRKPKCTCGTCACPPDS